MLKNQQTKRKFLNFENWTNGEPSNVQTQMREKKDHGVLIVPNDTARCFELENQKN